MRGASKPRHRRSVALEILADKSIKACTELGQRLADVMVEPLGN